MHPLTFAVTWPVFDLPCHSVIKQNSIKIMLKTVTPPVCDVSTYLPSTSAWPHTNCTTLQQHGNLYTAAWEVISWFGGCRGNMSKSSKMVLSLRCSPDTNPSASCWVVVPHCWNGQLKPGMRFLDPTWFDLSSLTRYHCAAEGSWRKTFWSGCIRPAVTITAIISVCVCVCGRQRLVQSLILYSEFFFLFGFLFALKARLPNNNKKQHIKVKTSKKNPLGHVQNFYHHLKCLFCTNESKNLFFFNDF